MTPSKPLGAVEEKEDKNNVVSLLVTSVSSPDNLRQNLKERNYMGLSDSSSSSSSSSDVSALSDQNECNLNLKATELRLGLPGSQSPPLKSPELCLINSANELDEKPFFPLHPLIDGGSHLNVQKLVSSGSKRGFSDAMDDGFSEGNFLVKLDADTMLSPRSSANMGLSGSVLENHGGQLVKSKEVVTPTVVQERSRPANETGRNQIVSANNNSAPAAKAQVVGWPPIRSFRKNSLATSSKNAEEVDGKAGLGTLFVKVSMDGAPYLRKVDLRNYSDYQDLSCALEKMFSCFTIGQYGSHGSLGREMLSESKLKDLLHGAEYVLTYEDKDGDWMLVGDVPWEMFIDTCKRLRIMKSSDAIGLAPRAVDKCKSRN